MQGVTGRRTVTNRSSSVVSGSSFASVILSTAQRIHCLLDATCPCTGPVLGFKQAKLQTRASLFFSFVATNLPDSKLLSLSFPQSQSSLGLINPIILDVLAFLANTRISIPMRLVNSPKVEEHEGKETISLFPKRVTYVALRSVCRIAPLLARNCASTATLNHNPNDRKLL
jgi:hypothetical protein